MTYIGNGPNFMVKSISDRSGLQTPSFFGYLIKWALPILLPIYVIIWALFYRVPPDHSDAMRVDECIRIEQIMQEGQSKALDGGDATLSAN